MTEPRLVLAFSIPVPPSAKNQKRAGVSRTGRAFQYRPSSVKNATHSIRAHAMVAARNWHGQEALLPDDDVEVRIEHVLGAEEADDIVQVRVYALGPRPKGRTGRRRDVTNIPELVLDALQGIAYANDNQVTKLTVERVLGNNPKDR
jgi:Holliday junction resolvase RusA-like endonuclease